MNILVINTGSSSLKFQIIKTDLEMIEQGTDAMLCKGLVERIGSQALISFEVPGKPQYKTATPIRDHKEALTYVLNWMADPKTKNSWIAFSRGYTRNWASCCSRW